MLQQPADAETNWPDLKGKAYDEAAEVIKKDRPDAFVQKLAAGSPVTMDYRLDRVRVFVNDQDIVVEVPRTG